MNDAIVVDEHYSFYSFSCKLNAAFIRALNVSIWRILKIYKEIPFTNTLYNS